jgi:hypothetical protein
MKLNEMIESKYLKREDLDGEEHVVTVGKLKKANLARDDQDPKYRWTVTFEEFPRPMVLNSTNLKRMFKYLGDDSEDWTGQKVVVYFDPDVEFGGEAVGGLRIRQHKAAGKTRAGDADVNRKLADAADGDVPF